MEAPEEEQLNAGDDLTAQRSTDPFVEADLANADKLAEQSSAPRQKKKGGLFDRFTRGEEDELESSPKQQSTPSPAGAQQSNLAVDMQEDEDLEIPAFLRRQAN
jgi:cell division protein FtsZ